MVSRAQQMECRRGRQRDAIDACTGIGGRGRIPNLEVALADVTVGSHCI